MTDDPLEHLRAAHAAAEKLAEAATPGPWYANEYTDYDCGFEATIGTGQDRNHDDFSNVVGHGYEGGGVANLADARHIAANDPAAVLRRITAERKILAKHPITETTAPTAEATATPSSPSPKAGAGHQRPRQLDDRTRKCNLITSRTGVSQSPPRNPRRGFRASRGGAVSTTFPSPDTIDVYFAQIENGNQLGDLDTAARAAGVKPGTIRVWMARGKIQPIVRGAGGDLFHIPTVIAASKVKRGRPRAHAA